MIKRIRLTLKLVREILPLNYAIYDMGARNCLSEQLSEYFVLNNSEGIDFDEDQSEIEAISSQVLMTTSFEVIEHLTNPYAVLKAVKSERILITVPLKVWFSRAYWNKDNPFDCHYHEFEERQFRMLLEKTGWEIIDSGKWYISRGIGIRPFLRLFWPSYLWIYAKNKNYETNKEKSV